MQKAARKSKRDPETYKKPFQRKLAWVMEQFWFDATLGVMILLNLVLVIIETDAAADDEKSPEWTNAVSRLIIVVFAVDITLQIYVGECHFWLDGMNIFDFMVVFTDVVMNLVELIAGPVLSVSILRIVRLLKLARVTKAFKIFSELRLLLAGLLGSVKAIFWGTVLLVLSLTIWAVIAVQFLHPLNKEIAETGIYGSCERCGRVYGSVFDAFIVFFQQIVAGDSWGMVTVTVIEKHPTTLFIYGPLFLSVGLAVLNLMLGVVVDVASQARGYMLGQIEEENLISKMELKHKLTEMCKSLDTKGLGYLDEDELKQGFQDNTEFRESLSGMSITEADLDILWAILDEEKTGKVGYVEFCAYCYKMRSSKEEFMLAYIKYYVTVIKADICEEIALVKAEMNKQDEQAARMENRIFQEEQVIEKQIDQQTRQINEAILASEHHIDHHVHQIEQEFMEQVTAANVGGARGSSDGSVQKQQKKGFEEKRVLADPHREKKDLTIDANQIVVEVTESMNARQGELLAVIEAMRKKLDYTFDKLIATDSSVSTCFRADLPFHKESI